MGRVAHQLNNFKRLVVLVPLAIVAAGIIGAVTSWHSQPKVVPGVSQTQVTNIQYQGVKGQTALDLLKQKASVQTKHYKFGDMVTSINGVSGNGPKYWSFYVNGKMSDVGASTYITKNSDQIEWKLQ